MSMSTKQIVKIKGKESIAWTKKHHNVIMGKENVFDSIPNMSNFQLSFYTYWLWLQQITQGTTKTQKNF